MARRHQQLEDSLKLHQFQHDVEDEVNWIHDKQPLASSSDLGRTLADVQSLQKKHLTLETELSSHSPVIDGVASTAQELIAAKHFACEQIQEQRASLLEMWADLKELVAQRSAMLSDSLHVQQVCGFSSPTLWNYHSFVIATHKRGWVYKKFRLKEASAELPPRPHPPRYPHLHPESLVQVTKRKSITLFAHYWV